MTNDLSTPPPPKTRPARKALAAFAVLLLAGTAIAAVSTNFIADPITMTQGGDTGSSTNFITEAAVGADHATADHAGGNQSGTSTSMN